MKARKQSASSSFMRAVLILERIAKAGGRVAAVDLIRELDLPKPTVHRIILMLERVNLVQRDPVAKGLVVGPRLRALALSALASSTQDGPRYHILARLAKSTGETSTFTMFERGEMLVVDRVESQWPLRVNLFPGSRVPIHCSASGKLMLAMMASEAQERLIRSVQPLRALTPNTVTQPQEFAAMLARIRAEEVSTDDQEFMTGLVAIAVPVLNPVTKRMIGALSLNAPAARMSVHRARRHLPALRQAAAALSQNLWGGPNVRVVASARR